MTDNMFSVVPIEVIQDRRLTLEQTRVLIALALADHASDDGLMVKSPCRKFVAAGCGSPRARGAKPHTEKFAAFSIPATSFGGSDGMAKAMPVTLRVPRSSTPIRAAAPCGSGTAVVHQAQLEHSMSNFQGAASRLPSGVFSFDLDEAVERENIAHDEVARLAQELAIAATPIARLGDGNCGAVICTILEALTAQGLYTDPRTKPKTPPRKQVIPQGLRTKVLERDAYRCVHCKTHVDLCVDHIKPESKGGALTMMNLQTLCRSCNSIKGAKL